MTLPTDNIIQLELSVTPPPTLNGRATKKELFLRLPKKKMRENNCP